MTAALPMFDGDTRTTAEEQVIDSILGAVMAQLEELSEDTLAVLDGHETSAAAPLLAMAEDLRETLIVTVRQRVSDWVCDTPTAADALYDSEWHRAVAG